MKVVALLTLEAGLDTLCFILKETKIDLVIGLSNASDTSRVSGYIDVGPFCQARGIPFLAVESYSFSTEKDKTAILNEDIDVLLVLGWQSLIPEWLIKHVKIAVLGGHGSSQGITAGRGRSPQNWALILGENRFFLSLFKIERGVDSGPVLMERSFPYSVFDDIETSYMKASCLMAEMICSTLNSKDPLRFVGKVQDGDVFYLPQRKPEDGVIDWDQPAEKIFNFVRGLARPYPGAFTLDQDVHVAIWKAVPFDLDLFSSNSTPGIILKVFRNGCFVVRCRNNGAMLVREWSSSDPKWFPEEERLFDSVDTRKTMSEIIKRHHKNNPGKPLSPLLIQLVE